MDTTRVRYVPFLLAVTLVALVALAPRLFAGAAEVPEHTATDPSTIPWLDAPSSARELWLPTPTVASSPPCNFGDLDVSFRLNQGAGGNLVYNLNVKNNSSAPCSVPDSPLIEVLSATGSDVLARTQPGSGSITVAAGGTVWSTVKTPTVGRCVESQGHSQKDPQPSAYDVLIELLGGTTHVDLRSQGQAIYPYCGIHADGLQAREPREAPWPVASLQAEVVAPQSVKAGSELIYYVDLLNPTSSDIQLTPCPVYVESFTPLVQPSATPARSPTTLPFQAAKMATAKSEGSRPTSVGSYSAVKLTYALNCGAAPVLPAGESVRFEMRMAVPADFPSGDAQLAWMLVQVAVKFPPATVRVVS